MQIREEDQLSRIPALRTWFRTSRAVVMHLSNGTMQINFFKDHTKIILCPLLGAVTYIDETRKNRTFRWELKHPSFVFTLIIHRLGLTCLRDSGAARSCPQDSTTPWTRWRPWSATATPDHEQLPPGPTDKPRVRFSPDESLVWYWSKTIIFLYKTCKKCKIKILQILLMSSKILIENFLQLVNNTLKTAFKDLIV